MEQKELIENLMVKYLNRNCTEQEIARLLGYFGQPQNESALKDEITRYFEIEKENGQNDLMKEKAAIDDVHRRLMENIKAKQSKIRYIGWLKISAAASVIVLMSLGAYLLFYYPHSDKGLVAEQISKVEKGGIKEILNFIDSTRMPLTDTHVETVAQQGVKQVKSNNKKGQLAISGSLKVGNTSYKKVIIPRGGQYELVLSDGTKVWLNAGSNIVFPVEFAANERRVKISGEVYFEVAPLAQGDQAKVPFIVSVGNTAEIKVLGTHFIVNSFSDENGAVKTTLLEGSVEVLSLESNQKTVLVPGQQAVILKSGDLNVKEVNTEEMIAWKNGYFYFSNTRLENVMQQLSRWYDVKIIYEGSIPDRKFSGKIHKNLNLNEVIDLLKFTKVNIRIEENSIIVTP